MTFIIEQYTGIFSESACITRCLVYWYNKSRYLSWIWAYCIN